MNSFQECAIVTGGAQGIGKAIARALLGAGYRVTIIDLDEEAGAETVAEYAAEGEIVFAAADIGDARQAKGAIERAANTFGRLDLLVNNAGIFISRPLADLEPEAWRRVIDTNLSGAFHCVKYAAPSLRASRGAVVNIASTRALMSEPHTEAYAASKGGLVALTHALSMSLAPEVRVNCVSPGWIDVSAWKKRSLRSEPALREIDHRQHPAGRVGQPEDVARLVLFLADKNNGFITGQNFVVDGGMTRKMIYAE